MARVIRDKGKKKNSSKIIRHKEMSEKSDMSNGPSLYKEAVWGAGFGVLDVKNGRVDFCWRPCGRAVPVVHLRLECWGPTLMYSIPSTLSHVHIELLYCDALVLGGGIHILNFQDVARLFCQRL